MKEQPLKIGIVGVGHFGSRHLSKWMGMDNIHLVGFYDIDPDVRQRVTRETGLPSIETDDLIRQVDVLDIVVPASSHFEIAEKALLKGKHVFVEKPFSVKTEDCQRLSLLAKEKGLTVGIGHIERFNPVYQALQSNLQSPPVKLLAFRQGPFIPKVGLDVSIIMELMVHDIDIMLQLIPSPIKSIQASGEILHSDKIDRATAVIDFENGSQAILFSSRAETHRRREILCEAGNKLYKANLKDRTFQIAGEEEIAIGEYDAMADELTAFITAVREGKPHIVNEDDGVTVIEIARQIEELILNT